MELDFPVSLQHEIEARILDGRYAHAQVLTVAEVCVEQGATAAAVRTVLAAEHRKGLVRALAGETFEVLGPNGVSLESVFQHTARKGFRPTSDMRGVAVQPASPEVAARLALPVGAPVYRLDRTRLVNGEALANQSNYIPYEVCPGLEQDDVSRVSFQKLMENKYHVAMGEMREEVAMVAATPQDAEILGLTAGAQVLAIGRVAVSATGCPVIYTDLHIRTDRYTYVAELWPFARGLLPEQPAR